MVSIHDVVRDLEQGKLASFSPSRAITSVTGNDAQSFLSRLSTNDLSAIYERGFAQTSFTTNKGRMVDHCLLFSMHPDEIVVVSSHRDPKILRDWLDQFHFIEDVTWNDLTETYTFSYLITFADVVPKDAFVMWRVTLQHGQIATIAANLAPHPDALPIAREVWETLRIMCFLPESPTEINDGVMPQNINLDEFISEQKGCYIGQEVIAKARTYQKHVKTLCGISVDDEDQFARLEPHMSIANPAGQIGNITCVAPIFMAGEVNALVLTDLTPQVMVKDGCLTLGKTFLTKNGDKS